MNANNEKKKREEITQWHQAKIVQSYRLIEMVPFCCWIYALSPRIFAIIATPHMYMYAFLFPNSFLFVCAVVDFADFAAEWNICLMSRHKFDL